MDYLLVNPVLNTPEFHHYTVRSTLWFRVDGYGEQV